MMRARLDGDKAVAEIMSFSSPLMLVHAYMALRLVRTWVLEDNPAARAALVDHQALFALEEQILSAAYDHQLRNPIAVLVRCGEAQEPDPQLPWACARVAEWAHGHGYPHLTHAFLVSAAGLSDSIPYYLAAELATVCMDLDRLRGAPSDSVRDLVRLRESLRKMITAHDIAAALPCSWVIAGDAQRVE